MKKKEGLELLKIKIPNVPMSDMLLLDWYAGMALIASEHDDPTYAAKYAFSRAEAMMAERASRD